MSLMNKVWQLALDTPVDAYYSPNPAFEPLNFTLGKMELN
jgi:hypothetical protein